MSSPDNTLNAVDRLLAELSRALGQEDWEQLGILNASIKPTVEPMMAALEAGEVDVAAAQLRLEELQQLIGAIDQSARLARQEAQDALKEVNRNRDVAKAYQNISSSRPK